MKRKKIIKIVTAMAEVLESNDWLVREPVHCESCDRQPAHHHTFCHNCGRKLVGGFAPIDDEIICILIDTYEAGKKADK
jgi:hypothetical protein